MTLQADLFFSFRSPYSYLATPRLHALTREWDLEINLRPVYPIAVRDPAFFARNPPGWVPYLQRDVRRVAAYLDLPFGFPRPDPWPWTCAARAARTPRAAPPPPRSPGATSPGRRGLPRCCLTQDGAQCGPPPVLCPGEGAKRL